MAVTRSFDQTIEHMALYLTQVEGMLILIGVTDDTVLRDHTVKVLRERLNGKITLREFRYDAEHLSLLEGVVAAAASAKGQVAISVTGLEALPRDKQSEAIKLLNFQRNRLGRTNLAVLLWVNQALLAEIATKAADFYSWRSATFFIEPPADWDTLESARRSYLQALVYHNQYVNLQGLAPMRGGQIVQMCMDDIFIPLRAEREMTLGEILGLREVSARSIEISELLRKRRAMVLGDPGSGKTTLLRYVVYRLAKAQTEGRDLEFVTQNPELADCLPVYVRIGLYAQHLKEKDPDTTLDDYAPLGCHVFQLPLTSELLKAEMERGRVLFLFDGLDEIIDATQRREVAQRIEAFARTCPACPIVVTSRIVGYREAPLSGEFSQFTISPFSEPEIRRFAENWYQALGMPNNAPALADAILGNDSIRRLASNPLLLTVIALIHYRGTKLPHHRVKLYQLAAETLVDQWMSARRVIPEGWNVSETLTLLLPAIAWHLHETTSSGLIGEETLHSLLVKTLRQNQPRLSENEAHTRAAQFRRNVAEFSGIFLERGLDPDGRGIYGFLHLTFEEYFAAVRLGDRWDRGGAQVLKPLLHDPRWTEGILLAAGRFGEFSQYQATCFVRAILEAGSEYEDILHRDLLLAARCLGDDVRVDPDLRHTILNELLKLYFSPRSPSALQGDIRKVFAQLGDTAAQTELLKVMTERLSDPAKSVRWAAARALCKLGPAAVTPEAVSDLLARLSGPEEPVRKAAEALGGIDPAAVTLEAFLALLTHSFSGPEEIVRKAVEAVRKAAEALGGIDLVAVTPEAVSDLLARLSGLDEFLHKAAEALGALGAAAATPEVVSALLARLSDPEESVRWAATRALCWLGAAAATPEVVSALLAHLSDPAESVRWAAAEALGSLSAYVRREERPELVKLFLPLARDKENRENREAGYLGLRNLLAAGM